jgi:hypothetical protein
MAVNINIPSEVTQTITDGVTTTAPSENAVFDALALKANSADLALVATTGDYNDLDNLPIIPDVSTLVPYTGATQNVDLGEFELKSGQVEFDQTPTGTAGVAVMRWNDTDGTVDLGLKGGNVTLQVGQEQVLRVVNKTATNVNLLEANYQAVRVTGAQGQRLKVDLALATNDLLSAETIGLVTETINNNQEGFITTSGLVRGINTTGSLQTETWADGDILYLSPTTAGNLTKVKPTAPNHLVIVGYVVSAHITQGSIFVKVDNGYELDELHNVLITSVADNNLLQYDSTASVWKNESLSTAGIQPTLTSGTNIKTINGNTLLGSGDLVISGGGGSGIFGISNASGVYTYYATLTLAMAAATSGQTIEMFADVTETGAVTITLKNGVNINGNGHTYTLNNSGLIHALSVATSATVSCNIINLNVIRTGGTGTISDNTCLSFGINTAGIINCGGSTFRNSGSGCAIVFNSNSTNEINYAVAYATTTWGAFAIFSNQAKLNNCIGYGTSGGYGIRCHSGGNIQNCTGISDSGYGIFGGNGEPSNCTGISSSGVGFYATNNAFNCVGRSVSSVGFECTNGVNVIGCVGISVSGRGFSLQNGFIYNCYGISSSSSGMSLQGNSKAYNITAKSTSSYALWGTINTTQIYGGTIICDWNNAGGYGIRGNGGFICNIILNCTFTLSNASAPYLFNDGVAQSISMRGNTYKGGSAFNINLTQAIITIEDAQGNIFI